VSRLSQRTLVCAVIDQNFGTYQKNKNIGLIHESRVATCNTVTREGQEIGVFELSKVNEESDSVIMMDVSGVFDDFDCHVDVSG